MIINWNGLVKISNTILRLILCALFLFPNYAFAGTVNIPGFSGSIIKAPTPAQLPVPQPSGNVNIPGFYGANITPPSATALPVLKNPSVSIPGVSVENNSSQNQLLIHQDQQNVIIDWASFNIGSDALTQFDQKGNTDWVALNRIWDLNPSFIFGSLKADGKIYLINQNGILFGKGSRVDVNSLTASALNIKNIDFLKGSNKFYVETGTTNNDTDISGNLYSYQGITFHADPLGNPDAIVSNYGDINASTGGSVFLIGPRVENFGLINAPVGQVGLAAGRQIALVADMSGNRTGLVVDVQDTGVSVNDLGTAWNREGGQLLSDTGLVGMYGRVVNHDGLIRSVTAVKQSGQIELRATEKITTGVNSVTESPISSSTETVDNSFQFSGGTITMGGRPVISYNASGDQQINYDTPTTLIVHQGEINAPSGKVNMNAGQRIYLETGSVISVGGGWSDEAASANVVTAQLNSVELADSYGQKGGLLQGQTISFNVLTGSSIGSVSGAISTRQETAQEKSIYGGIINISAGGDFIAKPASVLDFSGGGIRYDAGFVETTKLISGTKVYDISNAPLNIQYDSVTLGQTYINSFTKGGDAGALTVTAGTVVLNGQLNGSVTQGIYQTNRTLSDADALKLSLARGLEIPAAGSLTVDTTSNAASGIAVLPDISPLPVDFGPADTLTKTQTDISANSLTAAHLGGLTLQTNTMISIDKNASIVLAPGDAIFSPKGSSVTQRTINTFIAQAGRIEDYGEVTVPGGVITITTVENKNTTSVENEIFLAPGSLLDVSGQRIDNSLAGKTPDSSVSSGQIVGGTISIQNATVHGRGVFVSSGAVLDVSGGYQIDTKGKVTGGDAGTLDIGGPSLMLNGDIRGYAIADVQGKLKGGQIILHANDIVVTDFPPVAWPADFTADSPVPGDLTGHLILAGDRFSDTGFTRIELDSFHNITLDGVLAPSLVRLQTPVPASMQGQDMSVSGAGVFFSPVSGHDGLVRLDSRIAFQSGPSAFTARAGQKLPGQSSEVVADDNAKLTVSAGAVISTAPEGKITLLAPGDVTIAGILDSPSGQISVTSTGAGGASNLVVTDTGKMLSVGYNRLDGASTVPGLGYNYTPRDGGQVALKATNGDLTLQTGSLIDISGSDVVANTVSVGGKLVTYQDAGSPGALSLSCLGDLTFNSIVDARAKMSGLKGGTLTLNLTNANNGMDVTAADLTNYLAEGFDSLMLRSALALDFSGPIDMTIGRQLTLDAPLISGSGQDITLRSPWITLENTSTKPASGAPMPGNTGKFTLSSSGWLDLTGSINISGFQDADLEAVRDIRLTDQFYNGTTPQSWHGQLSIAGGLALKADRIYPTSLSDYFIQSGGKVTIFGADNPVGGPIFSVGGDLIIAATDGIDMEKGATLAAPMGVITLKGTGPDSRVYLADGSVVTTAGDAMVNIGSIDTANNDEWKITDKITNQYILLTPPGKAINIDAPEVVVKSGAKIDASGGGSLFAYQFQPGIEGSNDPIQPSASDPYTIIRPDGNNAYVIMSDRSIQLPGKAIYLEAGGGLSAGLYSLLPVQDAFLPGAVIIEQQKLPIVAGENLVTKDGYPVIAGYSTVVGTDIMSSHPTAYSVMNASAVLGIAFDKNGLLQVDPTKSAAAQGDYTIKSIATGAGGDLTVKGQSVIIDGMISAAALSGYDGGKISLSATDVQVQQEANPLGAGIDFGTPLNSSLKGKLVLAASTLSEAGFREVDLGDPSVTDSITIQGGAVLTSSVISLNANKTLTLETGAQLLATSGSGEIDLVTPGDLIMATGAVAHAAHSVVLDVNNVGSINGNLQSDSGALTLKSSDIFFDDGTHKDIGLHFTKDIWDRFTGFSDITLAGGSIQFLESFILSASDSLTLDAAHIIGMNAGGVIVGLNAPTVNLRNSGVSSNVLAPADTGTLTVNASRQLIVGNGDVFISGFGEVNFNSQNDLVLKGKGGLHTGGGDFNVSASRVTTTFDKDQTNPYIPADFIVDAGTGAINIAGNGVAPTTPSVSGGSVEFNARKIDLSGLVEVTAGAIKLTATGPGQDDGIFLHSGGRILAQGADDAPGGKVTLLAGNGGISLDAGSLINVSAGVQGDAGVVTMQAPIGGVTISGDLRGAANGGVGGSFVLDTRQLQDTDIPNLISTLNKGGFNESIEIRTRTGNIDIPLGQTLAADHIKLTADDSSAGSGQINIFGTLDASAAEVSGIVELYAYNDMNIWGTIFAKGTSKGEEDVILSSTQGFVNLQSGGLIDASGKGTGHGVVHFRAEQNNNDVKVNLDGAINSASAIYVEAVRVYDYEAVNGVTIDRTKIDAWQTDAQSFMSNSAVITSRLITDLKGIPAEQLYLLDGIEARNDIGDITLGTNWDLTGLRFGGKPGVLTLRAAGNLNIENNLVDHPTGSGSLVSSPVRDSWAYSLTAGSDTLSADFLAVNKNGVGSLTIADEKLVYTESAPIRFASGGDTVIGLGQEASPRYMINDTLCYNLATYDGLIQGRVGRDLNILGGVVQTATGDIDIAVSRDLVLGIDTMGGIRTTGQATTGDPTEYWKYAGGGNIRLDVGGSVGMKTITGRWWTGPIDSAWDDAVPAVASDQLAIWSASYSSGTEGIATMGGGDLIVRTGGDFWSHAGTFGQMDKGDLIIYSGGDIRGRFLNNNGKEEIHALGNFGVEGEEAQIEAFDSKISASARGNIDLGAIANPTIANDKYYAETNKYWDLTYTENTSVSLKAGGDITLSGQSLFYDPDNKTPATVTNERILPATVDIEAGGDILMMNRFALAPSPQGNLVLVAGGTISGGNDPNNRASIYVSDMDPANVYTQCISGSSCAPLGTSRKNFGDNLFNQELHGTIYEPDTQSFIPLHENDNTAIEIHAGMDIANLQLYLPKKAEITAGRDIRDIFYLGQNIHADDASEIKAKGDITFSFASSGPNSTGVEQAGPGLIVVEAGNSMDLGNSGGIRTTGDVHNSLLGSQGSAVIVVSGYTIDTTPIEAGIFFDNLRDEGSLYAMLKNGTEKLDDVEALVKSITTPVTKDFIDKLRAEAGSDEALYQKLKAGNDIQDANELRNESRTQTILPLVGQPSGSGVINMTSSQISTLAGASDIFIFASGELNVGKSAFSNNSASVQNTGITTASGGAINIFTNKDVNVNESRVMTFFGGDITLWSDEGNINAGRGSKTAVNAQPPQKVPILDPKTHEIIGYNRVFVPPAVGSGLRGVTYDPDGVAGPLPEPPPGNIYLFAARGAIDAAEAGISGGKIVLGATKVLNVQNISFSNGSIGVPSTTSGTSGIGTLSGSGNVAQVSQAMSDVSGMSAATATQASRVIDDMMTKWVDVKVIDFVTDEASDEVKDE